MVPVPGAGPIENSRCCMTRRCFFIDAVEPGADSVVLTGQTAHHIMSVLRMGKGEPLELRDGKGRGWKGLIVGQEKTSLHVQLIDKLPLRNESPLRITLAMALARTDRMELVVRQATELGVRRFLAYRSKRSQYGLSDAQAEKRCDRWLKIAREAMCQCDRMKVPEIDFVPDLPKFAAEQWGAKKDGASLKLLALEGERRSSLRDVWRSFPKCDEVLAVIGPEGGWTDEEVQEFKNADFFAVHLGPRILRLETAAVAFVAMVQMLWGDLSMQA